MAAFVMREDRGKKKQTREERRESSSGGVAKEREKRGPHIIYSNTTPSLSLSFFFGCQAAPINIASLICIPNAKPKSLI